MEDNKYYVPEISEFHVGMTIQIYEQCTSKMIRKIEWHDVIITENENELSEKIAFNRIPRLLKQNKIRVPYLTRQDIEECGFIFIKEDEFEHPKTYFGVGIGDDKKLRICVSGIRCMIYFRSNNGEEYTAFDGTIKNKSELRTVLKMLGV